MESGKFAKIMGIILAILLILGALADVCSDSYYFGYSLGYNWR